MKNTSRGERGKKKSHKLYKDKKGKTVKNKLIVKKLSFQITCRRKARDDQKLLLVIQIVVL